MPTYEYVCEKCGKRFEKFQYMNAVPLLNCPKCGGPVHRLIGAGAGVIYKGSGFYVNDYKHHTRCESEQTCCGRSVPCDAPPGKK